MTGSQNLLNSLSLNLAFNEISNISALNYIANLSTLE